MGESYQGITVPDGHPTGLRDAAGQFGGLSSALQGAASELTRMPGAMGGWSGPASVAFAVSCLTNGTAASAAGQALSTAALAAGRHADQLEHAQHEAHRAIADARDAQRRIDRAKKEIADAQARKAAAVVSAASASAKIAATSLAGMPSGSAHADLAAAEHESADAEGQERRARRDLHHAEDDLRLAKELGPRAEQAARDAASGTSAAFAAIDSSASLASFVQPGAPATARGGSGSSPFGWPPAPLLGTPAGPGTAPRPGFFAPLSPGTLATALGAGGGGLQGFAGSRQEAIVFARRFHYRELARLGNPAYDPLLKTPAEQIGARQLRSIHTGALSGLEHDAGAVRALHGASRVLGPFGAALQAKLYRGLDYGYRHVVKPLSKVAAPILSLPGGPLPISPVGVGLGLPHISLPDISLP